MRTWILGIRVQPSYFYQYRKSPEQLRRLLRARALWEHHPSSPSRAQKLWSLQVGGRARLPTAPWGRLISVHLWVGPISAVLHILIFENLYSLQSSKTISFISWLSQNTGRLHSIHSDDKPLKMEENFFLVFVWTSSENLDLDIISLSFLYLNIDSDASIDALSNVNGGH